jgi:hypothetical protein
LSTAALYIKNFGSFISKKHFESLDLNNQVALIIHEALRHQQITNNFGITNQSVQLITASVMNGNSVDNDEILTGKLSEILRINNDENNLQESHYKNVELLFNFMEKYKVLPDEILLSDKEDFINSIKVKDDIRLLDQYAVKYNKIAYAYMKVSEKEQMNNELSSQPYREMLNRMRTWHESLSRKIYSKWLINTNALIDDFRRINSIPISGFDLFLHEVNESGIGFWARWERKNLAKEFTKSFKEAGLFK